MTSPAQLERSVRAALLSIYEEMMWLSSRPNVTPGRARAWYTHIMAEGLKRKVRHFTGRVSVKALEPTAELRLEHHLRIQTSLSSMVERHRGEKITDPEEFIALIIKAESVHIVTREENYAAMRAKGNYKAAGIQLVPWKNVAPERRIELWKAMLRGKVANAKAYRPAAAQPAVARDARSSGV